MSGTTSGYLAGIASLLIDGDAWNVVSDLEWQVSGLKLETLKGQTAVEGPAAMPDPGFISATIRDRPDQPISQFKGATNLTVQVLQANGKTITGSNMWVTELEGVRTQEGTVSIRFESAQVTEATA